VKLVAEASHMLLEWAMELETKGRSQLELFVLGAGSTFRRHDETP
jgi:hypothetical protein